jgi:hypothetical protein
MPSMPLVENEQTKLLANAIDRASTACFTIGIATPLAGFVYNVSGFRSAIAASELAFGVLGWLAAAALLHLGARRILRGLVP